MVFPHGPEPIEDPVLLDYSKIEKKIARHRKWVDGVFSDIGSVHKMKKDLEYYMHLVVTLEKRVESLEKKMLSTESR